MIWGVPLQHPAAQRWADGINMWPNAVGTFKRPLAGVYVYKKFVWVFNGFIKMLIKNIFLNIKIKLNHDQWDALHYYKIKKKHFMLS